MLPLRPFFYLALSLLSTLAVGQSISPWPFEPQGQYPEGIVQDPVTQRFYVTSLKQGVIGSLDPEGNYRVFSEDSRLVSSAGLTMDTVRRRLLTVVHDDGASTRSSAETEGHLARLIAFDLAQGSVQWTAELNELATGRSHGNDVTLDPQGNAYVTDSFRPMIYRVSPTGEGMIFLQDEAFQKKSQQNNDPALNGITYHPNHFLLVTDYEKGKLWHVPLDNPADFREVQLPQPLTGADGISLLDPEHLVVARTFEDSTQTFVSQVDQLASTDNWQSATVVEQYRHPSLNCPTTVAVVDSTVYAVNSRFKELFEAPPSEHDTQEFTLTKIALDE